MNLLSPSYTRGVEWLQNHTAFHNDFTARRIAALLRIKTRWSPNRRSFLD